MVVNHRWMAKEKLQQAKGWLRRASIKTSRPPDRLDDLSVVFRLLKEIGEHLDNAEVGDGG